MGALIQPFVQICLLRLKPQDLPSSGTLLALALTAHALTSIVNATVSFGLSRGVAAGVVDTALMCGLTTGLLMLRTLRERTVQTLTALAGAGSVIGVVAYPVTLWLRDSHLANEPSLALSLLLLSVLGWSLAVSAHVLRHAVSAPFYIGLLIAVAFYWITFRIVSGLFPAGA